MKTSEVNIIFYDLIEHLFVNLSATEELDFGLMKLLEYGNINPLFTKPHLTKVKSLYLFKVRLLPFVTWLDHYILQLLVTRSENKDALQLLKLFDSKIKSYYNQPISSFPILSPTQLMIPLHDSEYTILAIKFRPPSRGSTTQGTTVLKDVIDIKITMKRKWKISSHDIQLVAMHKELELFYWMIPKCLLKVIEDNLVPDRKSGIIMLAVLPANFYTLEDIDLKTPEGPFSLLNDLRQDNTKVTM